MRLSDDCQAVDALRRKAVVIRSLGWPGYCGTTGSDEAGCSDRRRKGTWEGVRQLNHCLDHCRNCSRCHYVSFSEGLGDCSAAHFAEIVLRQAAGKRENSIG